MKKQIWIILISFIIVDCKQSSINKENCIVLPEIGIEVQDALVHNWHYKWNTETNNSAFLGRRNFKIVCPGDYLFDKDKYCEYHIKFDKTDYNDFCHK